ncbi:hypothetical protein BF49_2543 [Bradyrhizobium sp.]|uniref:hypothetical protein n=1 Tax=Bradyrhizobium sp. TaxID=376 RepID=UPI0007C1E058|nr:hypothetical protein [Bradyrhizobium sp.]CUT11463.1 hypothetical protein BF49_2543 [Bradyrhizobium sp.]
MPVLLAILCAFMAVLMIAGLAQDDARRAQCAEWRTEKHETCTPWRGVNPSSWFFPLTNTTETETRVCVRKERS